MTTSDEVPIHNNRQRAESFGSVAETYDRLRPSYPAELIEWFGSGEGRAAVDVGCGTGQAAKLLAAAGWDVEGVEIDSRMADVARSHGLAVTTSRFEDWQPGRQFDLVVSGQAWHWIDPTTGYQRAAGLLTPRGSFAAFWTSYFYEPVVAQVFQHVVGEHAPSQLVNSVHFGTVELDHELLDRDLAARSAEFFDSPVIRAFPHARVQSVDDWLDEALTHSPMALLDEGVRTPMLAELGPALTAATGGVITIRHETRATLLVRRGD